MSIGYWYHGTSKENADLILETGFHEGTYFAAHLEDAIGYGGPYVFAVALQHHGHSEKRPWQYKCPEAIPPDRICSLTHYSPQVLFKDESTKWRHIGYFNIYGEDYLASKGKEQDETFDQRECEKTGETFKSLVPWHWMEVAVETEKQIIREKADKIEKALAKGIEQWPLNNELMGLCLDYRVLDELKKRGYDTGKVKLLIPKKRKVTT